VAAILASMETLHMAMERGSDRAVGFAQQIEHSARRLAQIVEDLLDLSRLESSEGSTAEISLDVLVQDEVNRLRSAASEAGVSLDLEAEPIKLRGSPPDLALAVRNLCENALRYTDRDGHVIVRVIDSGANAEVEVEDTGVGIPRRALGRVFERFYRVDVARSRETGGTGLGLAIVKHVAERHGGSVSVTSQLGVGSTFRITLPKDHRAETLPAGASPPA
jgi:signal transduction histidine kinase